MRKGQEKVIASNGMMPSTQSSKNRLQRCREDKRRDAENKLLQIRMDDFNDNPERLASRVLLGAARSGNEARRR